MYFLLGFPDFGIGKRVAAEVYFTLGLDIGTVVGISITLADAVYFLLRFPDVEIGITIAAAAMYFLLGFPLGIETDDGIVECNLRSVFPDWIPLDIFFVTNCFISETSSYNIYKHNTFYNTQVHVYVSHTTKYESLDKT